MSLGSANPPQGYIAHTVIDSVDLDDNETALFGTDDDVSITFDPSVGSSGALVLSDDINSNISLQLRIGGNVHVHSTEDAAAVTPLTVESHRDTPTDGDTLIVGHQLNNSAGTATEFSRTTTTAEDVTTDTEDGSLLFEVMRAGSLEVGMKINTMEIVLNESGADRNLRVEGAGRPNALFVQGSDGNIGFGTSSPESKLEALADGAGTPDSVWFTDATFGFTFFDDQQQSALLNGFAGTTATQRPLFFGRRSRGTLDSPAAVQNGDWQFSVIASGYDGTGFEQGASINFETDGTVSTGTVPTALTIETGDNFSDRTERFRINSTGNVVLPNDDQKLFLGADTDYSARYDSGNDELVFRDEVNDTDLLRLPKNTDITGVLAEGGVHELNAETLATTSSTEDEVIKTDGSGGLETGYVEHGCLEISHTAWADGLSDEEIGRVQLQTGETMVVDRIEFQQKGGGTSASADVNVYDNDAASEVGSQTLGGVTKSPGSSGAAALVLFRLTNGTGGSINASVAIHYRIQGA